MAQKPQLKLFLNLIIVIFIKVIILMLILFFVMPPSERPKVRDEFGLSSNALSSKTEFINIRM